MTVKSLADRHLCCLTAVLFIVSLIVIGWYVHQYRDQLFQNRVRYKEKNCTTYEDFIRFRLQESELIWQKGVALRHKTEIESVIPENDPWKIVSHRSIWDFFYPNFNCPHIIERLGRVGDGGKWVCGVSQISKLKKECVVYSFGISGDTTFEQDILDRTNCSLHAYDYTINPGRVTLPQQYPSRATFSRLGLGYENSGSLRTLKTEMDQRGHKFVDILKIDIEGGEFQSLNQIIEDFPNGLPFGQLLVELHLNSLPQYSLYKYLKTWWESLEVNGLRAFHSEPNLYALLARRGKPKFYEMSFLNVGVDHTLLHA